MHHVSSDPASQTGTCTIWVKQERAIKGRMSCMGQAGQRNVCWRAPHYGRLDCMYDQASCAGTSRPDVTCNDHHSSAASHAKERDAHGRIGLMEEAASGSDNYYALLNVSRDASQDDIRRAYRALAAVAHPDKHADDVSTASANFVRVQAAYEVRGSAAKRCCLHCLVSLDLRKVKGAVAESVRRHTTQHSVRERRLSCASHLQFFPAW